MPANIFVYILTVDTFQNFCFGYEFMTTFQLSCLSAKHFVIFIVT